MLSAAATPTKIGEYVVKPISNTLYVDNCQGTEYKYDSLKNPTLKNPSENVFTDLFNDLTEPATTFMKVGTYVSVP